MREYEQDIGRGKIVDIKPYEEVEFPTDPEKRFAALFPAIGNSEAKCLTLLCLSRDPLTLFELHQKFLEKSGSAWKTSTTLQRDYCLRTLIPIGLVVEADILYYGAMEYVVGFRLTDAGEKYGKPIAAFLLEQSSRLPHSLWEIFGSTSSGGGKTRSPINRAKILKVLYEADGNLRREDIATQSGLPQETVGKHLPYFAKLGLVEYSSADPEVSGFVNYVLSENAKREDVKTVDTKKTLTEDVADLLFVLRRVNRHTLWERLKDEHATWSERNLRAAISTILTGLVKQRICQPEHFTNKYRSDAKITAKGRRIVSQIILPLNDRALAGDEELLFSWKRIPWQKFAVDTISKHKEASGNANKRPRKERLAQTLAIISQSPGIRPKEIESNLGRHPTDLLKVLLQEGKVRREKGGRATRYYSIKT